MIRVVHFRKLGQDSKWQLSQQAVSRDALNGSTATDVHDVFKANQANGSKYNMRIFGLQRDVGAVPPSLKKIVDDFSLSGLPPMDLADSLREGKESEEPSGLLESVAALHNEPVYFFEMKVGASPGTIAAMMESTHAITVQTMHPLNAINASAGPSADSPKAHLTMNVHRALTSPVKAGSAGGSLKRLSLNGGKQQTTLVATSPASGKSTLAQPEPMRVLVICDEYDEEPPADSRIIFDCNERNISISHGPEATTPPLSLEFSDVLAWNSVKSESEEEKLIELYNSTGVKDAVNNAASGKLNGFVIVRPSGNLLDTLRLLVGSGTEASHEVGGLVALSIMQGIRGNNVSYAFE